MEKKNFNEGSHVDCHGGCCYAAVSHPLFCFLTNDDIFNFSLSSLSRFNFVILICMRWWMRINKIKEAMVWFEGKIFLFFIITENAIIIMREKKKLNWRISLSVMAEIFNEVLFLPLLFFFLFSAVLLENLIKNLHLYFSSLFFLCWIKRERKNTKIMNVFEK